MRAQVVAVLYEPMYEQLERWIRIKVAGQEERSFDLMLPENIPDELPAIGKLIAGEHQGNFLSRRVPADDGPVRVDHTSVLIVAFGTIRTDHQSKKHKGQDEGGGLHKQTVNAVFCGICLVKLKLLQNFAK